MKSGKRRSAVARDLRSPKYRKRVIRSKKVYSRKRDSRKFAPPPDICP
jgi:hypothetical protein